MSSEKTHVVGKHVYANLYDIDVSVGGDEDKLRKIVIEAAKLGRMKLLDVKSWRVEGDMGGISVLALVVESHIAVHTWLKFRYATVDVYTCGLKSDPWKAFYYIMEKLKPSRYEVYYTDRSMKNI